ncbi:MAG: hypothetical protein R3E66_12725 [bacterium]
MSTYILTIDTYFSRPNVGTVLLPHLDPDTSLPRDQPFDVELRGAHGVAVWRAIARDSKIHEFVAGTRTRTFVELPEHPSFGLHGVEVWLPELGE